MANMGFFGVENYFLTFSGTIQYLFYPYPVYPVCILGVFCWDPNFGPIELYFMSNMVFFWVGSSFMTFSILFSRYFLRIWCIRDVFWVYSGCIQLGSQFSSNRARS